MCFTATLKKIQQQKSFNIQPQFQRSNDMIHTWIQNLITFYLVKELSKQNINMKGVDQHQSFDVGWNFIDPHCICRYKHNLNCRFFALGIQYWPRFYILGVTNIFLKSLFVCTTYNGYRVPREFPDWHFVLMFLIDALGDSQ